jgi:xylulokinase
MGTFICTVPVYSELPDIGILYKNSLNIENHVVPGLFISLLYNFSGGALIKWFRDVFAGSIEKSEPKVSFDDLFGEIPETKTGIISIPRFGSTGPPDYFSSPRGCLSELSLEHSRGDILKAILEGITFYFRENLSLFEKQNINIHSLIANGGGASSSTWMQLTSTILNKPVIKNKVNEAGSLGAAILALSGSNSFESLENCISKMIHQEQVFYPDHKDKNFYDEKFSRYKKLYNFLKE